MSSIELSARLIVSKTWDGSSLESPSAHSIVTIRLPAKDDDRAKRSAVQTNVFVVEIDAPFYNDPAPPNMKAGESYDQLWEHEVVEIFIAVPIQEHNLSSSASSSSSSSISPSFDCSPPPATSYHYLELEFSPLGAHFVLQLNGVRKLMKSMLPLSSFQAKINGDRWQGHAQIPMEYLPPYSQDSSSNTFLESLNYDNSVSHRNAFLLNAYSIHGVGDRRTYCCATPLPANCPDFHQPSRFPLVTFR